MLVQRLVELLFLSLVKFHGHQFLSALAHPAQGRPHGFPAQAQNPAHVGRWGSGRALSLRHTPASEGRAGGPAGRQSPPRRDTQRPGCPAMPRDAPGCPGMLRRLRALPRLPARGRPRRTLRPERPRTAGPGPGSGTEGGMPLSERRGRDSPRASGSTVVSP